jgi:hypothetical protein
MSTAPETPESHAACGPLIICGMHRSGTSLLASLLDAAGLHLGDDLLGASPENPRGHFEDIGILEFHRTALVANGIVSEGYTTQAGIVVPETLRREAAALMAARTGRGRAWGWKEPRTTLFLDFWSGLLPDARYLLVFRRPWEVVDSLFRRNETTFLYNPAFAIEVWTHYNRLLLEFARRHPDAALVCEATQVISEPERLLATLATKFGLSLGKPGARYDATLYQEHHSRSLPALLAATCPAAHELYLELRELAGSASPLPDDSPAGRGPIDLRDHVFHEWGRASQHMLRCRDAERRTVAIGEQLMQIERAHADRERPGNNHWRWRRLLPFKREPEAA